MVRAEPVSDKELRTIAALEIQHVPVTDLGESTRYSELPLGPDIIVARQGKKKVSYKTYGAAQAALARGDVPVVYVWYECLRANAQFEVYLLNLELPSSFDRWLYRTALEPRVGNSL